MGEATAPAKEASGAEEEHPFPLTEMDKWVLSLTDEEYQLHSWDELKEIIATNNLSILKRKPSDLRRYMKWSADTKREYGSMTTYLLKNRLPSSWGRPPFTPASLIPFESPSDYSILINDWPYGLSPEINHIVVWSRTIIETDEETGDVTPESRARIEQFVTTTFIEPLEKSGGDEKWGVAAERVMWFKNWVALQSVRNLEHVHVLVRGVGRETLEGWTGNKVDQS